VVVARVTRPHGIKGGLLLRAETDHAEELFTPGRVLHLVEPPTDKPADEPSTGLPEALTIVEAAPHGAVWRVVTEEIADRSSADRFRGVHLAVPHEELPELGADEYFFHDLIGLRVEDEEGRELGSVSEVYEGPADPLLAVEAEGRERFIPFRREFVVDVDLEAGLLRVTLPEGLLDL
jgi:16S rRNA processing protein RimM